MMMMMMREKTTTTSKRTTTTSQKEKSVPPKRALSPAVAVLVSSLASPPKRVRSIRSICTKGSRDNFGSNSNELFE